MDVLYQALITIPTILLLVSCVPIIQRHLQRLLQPPVSSLAKEGLDVVLALQRYRNRFLTQIVDISAFSVSIIFYSTFIPLLLYIGYPELTVCLGALLAIQIYCGTFLKDLISAPRPLMIKDDDASFKIQAITQNLGKIDNVYQKEFGFPSTHTSQSIAMNLFLIWYFHDEIEAEVTMYTLYGLSIAWTMWIAFGRMYSCMHTPIDVMGGVALGTVLFGVWTTYCQVYMDWIVTAQNAHIYLLLLMILLLTVYPQPAKHTPSFEDATTAVAGAWYSISISYWLLRDFIIVQSVLLSGWYGWVQLFLRLTVGLFLGLAVKESTKYVLQKLIQVIETTLVNQFESITVDQYKLMQTIGSTITRFMSYTMYGITLYCGVLLLENKLLGYVGMQ
eukprot:TRINITY_DN5430_c0_g2_i1.p1 TRINITY_DN5430_c0_g2~~TRINITY_DN5430_c0_g2_i1.p1  ORF type:complete len:390 (+),score=15.63 TRINITY_DN5430_c0_g2_i1:151-1320(+)